jgi:hypothetical protein
MISPVLANDPGADAGQAPLFMQGANVRMFWTYMRSVTPPDGMAKSADFDLMAIHRLAPDMIICDFDYETYRSRLRFVGTRVVDVLGEETTGRYLDEVNVGPYRSQQLAAFSMAVASGWPQWTLLRVQRERDGSLERIARPGMTCERLVVPLAGPSGTVRQLAAIMWYAEGAGEGTGFEHRELAPGKS